MAVALPKGFSPNGRLDIVRIHLTILAIFALPFSAFAVGSQTNCEGRNHLDRMFDKFSNTSDAEIKKLCKYGKEIKTTSQSSSEDRFQSNRTSTCESDQADLRRLAKEYREAKTNFCREAQAQAQTCQDQATQLACMEEAAAKTEAGKRSMEEMAKIARDQFKFLKSLEKLQRLRQMELAEHYRNLTAAIPKFSPNGNSDLVNSPVFDTTKLGGKKLSSAKGAGQAKDGIDKGDISSSAPRDPMAKKPTDMPVKDLPRPDSNPLSTVSQSTPANLPGDSQIIRASDGGVNTIGEYYNRLPLLLEEQRQNIRRTEELQKGFEEAEVKHRAEALELGANAIKLYQSVSALKTASAEGIDPVDPAASRPNAILEERQMREKREKIHQEGSEDLAKNQRAIPIVKVETSESDSTSADEISSAGQVDSGHHKDSSMTPIELAAFENDLRPGVASRREKLESLRDRLRQRLKGMGEKTARSTEPGSEENQTKSLVADLIKEQRSLASDSKETRTSGPSVGDAMADIESQVAELLRAVGILGAETESLFERVSSAHHRSLKNGHLVVR